MKITFILPVVLQNGGCRVVAIYAEKLLAMGHDVTVISRLPEEKTIQRRLLNRLKGRPDKSRDPNRTIYFEGLGDRHVQLPHKFPLDATQVPDADIVIATWWRTAFEVAALPPAKGQKIYFVQGHEVYADLPWDIALCSYWLPLDKITISGFLQDILTNRYNSPASAIVPNSVDTDQFDAPPREKGAVPTVGLLYSKAPVKGVDISLRAIAAAKARFPDLRVVSFGADTPDRTLPLPPNSRFHHLPPQDEIAGLYATCDVWLCGSRSEGFHLPPLEAMACRCPVVMTRIGGAVETVTEGVNGHIVDIDDADALGHRLIDVLSLSPGDWRSMSEASHARAHGYSWDDAARAFEKELQKRLPASR